MQYSKKGKATQPRRANKKRTNKTEGKKGRSHPKIQKKEETPTAKDLSEKKQKEEPQPDSRHSSNSTEKPTSETKRSNDNSSGTQTVTDVWPVKLQ